MFETYLEKVAGIIGDRSDILMFDIIFDTLYLKAALCSIRKYLEVNDLDISVSVSLTLVDQSDRILTDQTGEYFYISMK